MSAEGTPARSHCWLQLRAHPAPRQAPLLVLVGDLTSGAELLERSQLRGADDRIQLAKTTEQVLALKQRLPGLVVLAGPDPTAAQRLLDNAQ